MKNRKQVRTRFVACRMDASQERKLIALAGAKGISVSAILRELVDNAPDPLVVWTEINTERPNKASRS